MPDECDREVQPLLVSRGEVGCQTAVVGKLEDADEAVGSSDGVGHALETREEVEVLPRRQPGVLGRPLWDPADPTTVAAAGGGEVTFARLERTGQDR